MQDIPKIGIQVCSAICTNCRHPIADDAPRWGMSIKIQSPENLDYIVKGFSNFKHQEKEGVTVNSHIIFCETCFRENLRFMGADDALIEKLVDTVKPQQVEGRHIICSEVQ